VRPEVDINWQTSWACTDLCRACIRCEYQIRVLLCWLMDTWMLCLSELLACQGVLFPLALYISDVGIASTLHSMCMMNVYAPTSTPLHFCCFSLIECYWLQVPFLIILLMCVQYAALFRLYHVTCALVFFNYLICFDTHDLFCTNNWRRLFWSRNILLSKQRTVHHMNYT